MTTPIWSPKTGAFTYPANTLLLRGDALATTSMPDLTDVNGTEGWNQVIADLHRREAIRDFSFTDFDTLNYLAEDQLLGYGAVTGAQDVINIERANNLLASYGFTTADGTTLMVRNYMNELREALQFDSMKLGYYARQGVYCWDWTVCPPPGRSMRDWEIVQYQEMWPPDVGDHLAQQDRYYLRWWCPGVVATSARLYSATTFNMNNTSDNYNLEIRQLDDYTWDDPGIAAQPSTVIGNVTTLSGTPNFTMDETLSLTLDGTQSYIILELVFTCRPQRSGGYYKFIDFSSPNWIMLAS